MEKKKLLLVTQEIEPYTEDTAMSVLMAKLPKFLADNDYDLRVLMPRYSCVNERRHRLHEVVRLSGMNIIIDEYDYPLIIKVASLPGTRLQVYFLDNEEFFKRSSMYGDDTPFEDNIDRAAFFCKGAIEIVKKFGWAPDVVLCEGWMTGLMPFYLRTAYKTEPLFSQAEIIYGLFDSPFEQIPADRFFRKAAINNLKESDLEIFRNPDGTASVNRGAVASSDVVVVGSENFSVNVDYIQDAEGKIIQPFTAPGSEAFMDNTLSALNTLFPESVEG